MLELHGDGDDGDGGRRRSRGVVVGIDMPTSTARLIASRPPPARVAAHHEPPGVPYPPTDRGSAHEMAIGVADADADGGGRARSRPPMVQG